MEFEDKSKPQKLISAEDFLALLASSNGFESYQVEEDVFISYNHILKKEREITFKNCRFENLEFGHLKNNLQITFKDCKIKNLLISETYNENDHFVSSSFQLFIKEHSEIQQVSFSNSFKCLAITDSTIGAINSTEAQLLNFTCLKTIFNSVLNMDEVKIRNAKFRNCTFEKRFSFYESTISKSLELINCHFKDEVLFNLNRTSDLPNLSVTLDSCKSDESIKFNGGSSSIKRLFAHKHRGRFEISNLNINVCEIWGEYEKDSNYRFNNLTFERFKCAAINSILQLSSIKSQGENSEFLINASDLNNTSLFDVNLQSFDTVIIEKSDFTNMTTSRVTWFEDKQLKTAFQSEKEDPYERREFYRQLKYNQEKQGNKIQALTFQSLEMQYYGKELTPRNVVTKLLQKNKYSALLANFILAFTSQNRFILWVGKSNNHGQSFLKPIVILIALSFPFYWLILRSVYTNIDSIFSQEHLTVWAQLLNPIHDVSKIFGDRNPDYTTHLLDLAWKIIEAILIFQTITAFRKYIRL
jgi:hypothetical protein